MGASRIGAPVAQPRPCRVVDGPASCSSAAAEVGAGVRLPPLPGAGVPFLRPGLRHRLYGPHGRKSAIAVLSETRKEAASRRRAWTEVGEGRLWNTRACTRTPALGRHSMS